jgi:hypothetical protein
VVKKLGDSHFWAGLMDVKDQFYTKRVNSRSTMITKLDFREIVG